MWFKWHIPGGGIFYIGMWSPAGKELISWLSCMWCFLVFCHFPIWCLGSVVVLDCINFWFLPSALLLYRKNKPIFLSGTTMPSTLIFGMQHHLVRLYPLNSIWGTGTIKWTRLRAHTFTKGIYWENLLVWHHKAYNIDICYVASLRIPLLSLFT